MNRVVTPHAPEAPRTLGATLSSDGCRFAVYSRHATRVELCLFEAGQSHSELARYDMLVSEDDVWYVFVPGVGAGQRYGYRVHGPYAPEQGHRFNASKLLIDPYARRLDGDLVYDDAVYGYPYGGDTSERDDRDSAAFVPKCVVEHHEFDWDGDAPPDVRWEDSLIYECHVKGLTKVHPEVPAEHRGTYLGLASPPIIEHLRALGVTAVELLPVHEWVDERRLVERGLVNYWGYNPMAWFAPSRRYASDPPRALVEFKSMVRSLHRAGLEVILDVVYNHTAESDERGPTLSWRGMDNASYYELEPQNRRSYVNAAQCGNTMNVAHPRVVQLIMDNLRFWTDEMHVDGFRFDLMTALTRDRRTDPGTSSLVRAIEQDPTLSRVKLIAEPWDATLDGYRLGGFPPRWSEWNDRYKTTVCRFWRGDAISRGALSERLAGSSNVFNVGRRRPRSSVNYVASHDGFTLRDLVTYGRKHNDANGQNNQDGDDGGFSHNWGCEGPTDDQNIAAMREQIMRNLLATLAFSLGVPMITAGDEMGRTQWGNNNAYCQDHDRFWIDWRLPGSGRRFLSFSRAVFALRRDIPALHRSRFFSGTVECSCGLKDVTWLDRHGGELVGDAWSNTGDRVLGVLLHSCKVSGERAPGISYNTALVIFNGEPDACSFSLPGVVSGRSWRKALDTESGNASPITMSCEHLTMAGHSVVTLVSEMA